MKRKKPETLEEYEASLKREQEENERIKKNYYDALDDLFHLDKICAFLERLLERGNP